MRGSEDRSVIKRDLYAGEREKILTINKLRDENVALQEKYHHIELIEIELGAGIQRGFFDYIFEDPAMFEAAHARTMQRFRASKYVQQSAAA